MNHRIDLYDSTGMFCGYAVQSDSGEFMLYDKNGKFIKKVSQKTKADHAIEIILSSLQCQYLS